MHVNSSDNAHSEDITINFLWDVKHQSQCKVTSSKIFLDKARSGKEKKVNFNLLIRKNCTVELKLKNNCLQTTWILTDRLDSPKSQYCAIFILLQESFCGYIWWWRKPSGKVIRIWDFYWKKLSYEFQKMFR